MCRGTVFFADEWCAVAPSDGDTIRSLVVANPYLAMIEHVWCLNQEHVPAQW